MADHAIRVLHLVGSGEHGGPNTYVVQLLRSINRSQFKLDVCTFGSDGPAFDEMRAMGAEILMLSPKTGYGPAAVLAYFKYLKRSGYDVVHAHVGSRLPRMAAHLAGCRTIAHAHGRPEAKVGEARGRGPSLRTVIRTSFDRGSDSVVACSDDTAHLLSANCPDLNRKLDVIHNGIDLAQWRPLTKEELCRKRQAAGFEGAVVVGFAGRLVTLKRVDCVVEAAELCLHKNPEFIFVILGDGPLRPTLEDRAKHLGDRILFLGWRPSIEWLPLFDVLVLPSESEGFPYCILEAMASGLPVVASAVGGVTEALVDGVTGIKIRAGNPRDLQGAIDILARNPEMRIRMGMAGRCKVEEEFGAHSMARKVEALYTRLGCTAVP